MGITGALWCLLCALCLVSTARGEDSRSELQLIVFAIPAADAKTGLNLFARQSGTPLLYLNESLGERRTNAVNGRYTVQAALELLLRDTGIAGAINKAGVLTISVTTPENKAEQGESDVQTNSDNLKRGNSIAAAIVAFFAAAGVRAQDGTHPEMSATSQPGNLEEIVVTAQKRVERLQDVPVPVTSINAAALAENNQPRLRDFFDSVPGFVVSPAPSSGNQQMLTIRGISSGAFGNPTVGITVDDVPYGGFTREFAPDIDPSDIERVEVLRGPQGALYGASSMGGLVKFVTVDPSTAGVSGHVQADVNGVHNGSEPGYSFRGSVNVPLSDTIAIRASAFDRQDAGYIDNPVLGLKGINSARTSGGRLSALWRMSDGLSLKLSALYQDARSDGLSDVDIAPGLGDLQQNYIAGVGPSDTKIQAYSAILKDKLGNFDLTSVTGYNVYQLSSNNDYTYLLGPTALRLAGVGGTSIENAGRTGKFTEELRAQTSFERVDWLLGGFYTHERIDYFQSLPARNPITGAIVGPTLEYIDNGPITHKEYAAFTDVTIHFTDRFDVQLGGRESHLEELFAATTEGGLLLPKGPVVIPAINPKANVFTYLLTPQLKVSPDLMIYARIASGYRPGRSNANNPDPAVPRASSPDKTQNYEVGVKGDVLNKALTFDASFYYIDWKDIQINLSDTSNNIGYFTNGSTAKSQGVELSIQARPWAGATLGAWGTYDDAVLTQGFPLHTAAYGPTGARLPYSARSSANLSLTQDAPVTNSVTGFVGGTLAYVGDRQGLFVATPARAVFPAYVKFDLRAGFHTSSWTVNAYANNVTDRRGVLGGGAGNFPPYAWIYIQPRTIGVSVSKDF